MSKTKFTEIETKIKKYKLHEVNYAYQNTVSYSQYSIYKTCPYQWYLSYFKGLQPYSASIHTVFGTAIHETLQHYLKVMFEQSGAAADKEDIITLFKDRFRAIYKEEFDKMKCHFSSPDEMREFYEDGVAILDHFKKNRAKYFSTRGCRLLGIELPLMVGVRNNVFLKGFIDFIIEDTDLGKITIYDIKTSSYGWRDKEKKNETKVAQILLYKEYFAKQYNIDVDLIDVEFFIVKRKVYDNPDYTIPRIQTFRPASGKTKRKLATEQFNEFLHECFDNDGSRSNKTYPKNVDKSACMYCPYNNKPELCDKKM